MLQLCCKDAAKLLHSRAYLFNARGRYVAIVPLLHPKEGKSPENLELSDILLKFATKMILLKK
jgi:hypothetical protein